MKGTSGDEISEKEFYEKTQPEALKRDMASFISLVPNRVKVDNVDYKVISKEKCFFYSRLMFGLIDYVSSELELANQEVSLQN